MVTRTKKATFNLHTEVLKALNEAMAQGAASSKNALVEQAILKELKERKRQARKALYQEAAKDPLFVKDIKDMEADFQYADADIEGGTEG